MNKNKEYLGKMIDLVMLAYAIGLIIGESIRETAYSEEKAKNYSELFIFLNHLQHIAIKIIHKEILTALALFQSNSIGCCLTLVR